MRGICQDRSPGSMKRRFAYHIMGNLSKFKKTEAQLIEADEKAKAAKVEATGQTVPMHNVLFVQYLLLATEQVGSYFKSCILLYHLTYIYSNSFGCEQNIL